MGHGVDTQKLYICEMLIFARHVGAISNLLFTPCYFSPGMGMLQDGDNYVGKGGYFPGWMYFPRLLPLRP